MDMPLLLPRSTEQSPVYCTSPEDRNYPGTEEAHPVDPEHPVDPDQHHQPHTITTSPDHRQYAMDARLHAMTNPTGVQTERDTGDHHYDSVMQWLNQQACGGTVKRKRKINKQQRLAANMRERRRMTSLNTAFEKLKETIPIFPYEKKLSRIQTLRLAIDYIEFMGSILHQPTTASSDCNPQQSVEQGNSSCMNTSAGQSPDSSNSAHLSPDCIQKYWS